MIIVTQNYCCVSRKQGIKLEAGKDVICRLFSKARACVKRSRRVKSVDGVEYNMAHKDVYMWCSFSFSQAMTLQTCTLLYEQRPGTKHPTVKLTSEGKLVLNGTDEECEQKNNLSILAPCGNGNMPAYNGVYMFGAAAFGTQCPAIPTSRMEVYSILTFLKTLFSTH